jgi:hypothetical protein
MTIPFGEKYVLRSLLAWVSEVVQEVGVGGDEETRVESFRGANRAM